MSRTQLTILILTMPFWLGMMMVLWAKNPLFIVVPCGAIGLGGIALIGTLLYGAEIRTAEDWDLVIRSVLHRLGFSVKPPKSLLDDIELDNPELWHNHNEHQHDTKKDNK
ncbi:MAG: hypothetical protein Phog2KO_33600 [Phototrophicaceae bacterium]